MTSKILLVDDEAGIRKVLGISLSDMGYEVLTAENGEEALKLFREHGPAIVLTDIKMPGMDGIEVLRKIKKENPETEVIVITGHGDMDLAIKSLKFDATDFITKPVDDRELENALRKCGDRILIREKLRDYTHHLEALVQQKTERLAAASGDEDEAEMTQRYQDLFDAMPGYVAVLDRSHRITAANGQFKADFAYDGAEDARCYTILKGRRAPCDDCPAVVTIEEGRAAQSEMSYTTRSGDTCNVLAWTTPIRDADTRITHVMVMATDVTQILDLQDHLSSLGLMIGSVSHGIKGLLTSLDGGLYMLDSGFSKDDPNQVQEGLDIVKLMTGRIKNMVLDILYYAKERELNRGPVEVETFISDIANVAGPKVRQGNIALETEVSPELAGRTVEIDEDQMRLSMVNLVENAVDACLDDRSQTDHTIRISAREDDGHAVFEVADDGTGMDEATQEKIFTLFFSSKSNKGTGIGLFVTQKIVRQHGGEIRVESTPGEGSRFTIRIPVGEGEEEAVGDE